MANMVTISNQEERPHRISQITIIKFEQSQTDVCQKP